MNLSSTVQIYELSYIDFHKISSCNINAYSAPEVIRIKDVITLRNFSRYFLTYPHCSYKKMMEKIFEGKVGGGGGGLGYRRYHGSLLGSSGAIEDIMGLFFSFRGWWGYRRYHWSFSGGEEIPLVFFRGWWGYRRYHWSFSVGGGAIGDTMGLF